MDDAEDLRANHIADLAAEKAVAHAFRMFGIDIHDFDAVNGLRDDWRFLRDQREEAERWSRSRASGYFALFIAVISSILTGIAAWAASFWGRPPAHL